MDLSIKHSVYEFELSSESKDITGQRLVHIGTLSHKYVCDTIEKWVQQRLDSKLDSFIQEQPHTPYLPTKILGSILRASINCNWPSTKTGAESALLKTCGTWDSSDMSSPQSNSGVKLRAVLDIADDIDDASLKARAYSAFLDSVEWSLSPSIRGLTSGLVLNGEEVGERIWWDSLEALSVPRCPCALFHKESIAPTAEGPEVMQLRQILVLRPSVGMCRE
jgi:hypothetical protein